MATNDTKSPMFILTNGYIIKFEGFNDDTWLEGVIYEEDGIGLIGSYHQQKNDPPPNNEDVWYEMFAGKIIREALEDRDLPIPVNISSTVPPREPPPPPVSEEPPETDVDPEVENTTSFPMYVLEDGNVISIKRMGPQKQTIATKDGVVTFEFAPFLNSAPNIDLANEAALSLETVIVREIPPAAQPSPGPLTSYSFEGTVINVGEQAPLNGAKIEDSRGKTSTSDSEGKFIIEGDYYPTTPLKLTISLKDYGTETVTISKEDGGIRNDLNVFKLKTTKVSADDEILKNKGWNEKQQQELYKEERKDFIKSKSKQLLQTIKVKLTPYIILELAKLGVPNPSLVLSTVEKMSDKEERQRLKQKAKDLKEEQEKKKAERKAAKEENETESDNTIV